MESEFPICNDTSDGMSSQVGIWGRVATPAGPVASGSRVYWHLLFVARAFSSFVSITLGYAHGAVASIPVLPIVYVMTPCCTIA